MPGSRLELIADGLGLPAFATDAAWASATASGDHVLGTTVHAWVARVAVERWGRPWVERGSVRVRNVVHVPGGAALTIEVDEETADVLALRVTGDGGVVYAEASVAMPADDVVVPSWASTSPDRHETPAPPTPEALDGLDLGSVTFGFEAARDLPPAALVADAVFWAAERCAHPAWLLGGLNLLLRERIAFDGARWIHAATFARHRGAVSDGSTVEVRGRISRVFDGGRHRFADVEAVVTADAEPVLVAVETIVYATEG